MPEFERAVAVAVEKMPVFPESVTRVLTVTADINCSQRDLVEEIKRDPVLTLKILRLVNSVFFGLSRDISSIDQASVYLGLNTLKNVSLGLAVVGAIPKTAENCLDMGGFWLHSLAVGTAARMLGLKLGISREDGAEYFAAGLLHDIGKVVFSLYMPEDFEKVLMQAARPGTTLYQCEKDVFGMTHVDVGAMLARKWSLPVDLRDAIARHHIVGSGNFSQLLECVFAANQIAKRLSFGAAGDFEVERLPTSVKERFSMSMDELIRELPDLDEKVEHARIFIKLGEA
ncbi:HDOD domain-containing protein [Pseudodesulfovibrio sp. JC047]|uniref:HDOD domain-containing protein n=1 Tax=Pseudodesulfovibrio sp. JC047 TaxID=2683199 RepID=UPI0013D8B149|nr:HDOD domain-containing protein [Pseudodesulfovibrio sp. JC047]NDV19297.1 HDOD domain-containing protein [Pseudodesulfovibrio sp. JC047]